MTGQLPLTTFFSPVKRQLRAIEQLHHCFWISRTGESVLGSKLVNSGQFIAGELDVERSDVFLKIFATLGSGNRDDVAALGQDPGKGELGRSAFFFARNFLDATDQVEIVLEIVSLKPRSCPPVVILRQIFRLL